MMNMSKFDFLEEELERDILEVVYAAAGRFAPIVLQSKTQNGTLVESITQRFISLLEATAETSYTKEELRTVVGEELARRLGVQIDEEAEYFYSLFIVEYDENDEEVQIFSGDFSTWSESEIIEQRRRLASEIASGKYDFLKSAPEHYLWAKYEEALNHTYTPCWEG